MYTTSFSLRRKGNFSRYFLKILPEPNILTFTFKLGHILNAKLLKWDKSTAFSHRRKQLCRSRREQNEGGSCAVGSHPQEVHPVQSVGQPRVCKWHTIEIVWASPVSWKLQITWIGSGVSKCPAVFLSYFSIWIWSREKGDKCKDQIEENQPAD